jgi:putative transposase
LRYLGGGRSRHRVARWMRSDGLHGIPQPRRWRVKPTGTRPDHVHNHLARDFSADEPNTKWVTDITYIRTAEGWLYLAVVLDLYSGRVVGLVDERPPRHPARIAGRLDGTVAA